MRRRWGWSLLRLLLLVPLLGLLGDGRDGCGQLGLHWHRSGGADEGVPVSGSLHGVVDGDGRDLP